MNKSEYTTKIEGYPLNDGKIPPPKNDLVKHTYTETDQTHLENLIELYNRYQTKLASEPKDFREKINLHFKKFLGSAEFKKGEPLDQSGYFPRRIKKTQEFTNLGTREIPIVTEINSSGGTVRRKKGSIYAHPGKWAELKETPHPSDSGITYFLLRTWLEGNTSYKYETTSDPITDAIADAEAIAAAAGQHTSDIMTIIGFKDTEEHKIKPSEDILDYGTYLNNIFNILFTSSFNSMSCPVPPTALLSGLKILLICITQWRERIKSLANTSDEKGKAMFARYLKTQHGLLSDKNTEDLKQLVAEYEEHISSSNSSGTNLSSLSSILDDLKQKK